MKCVALDAGMAKQSERRCGRRKMRVDEHDSMQQRHLVFFERIVVDMSTMYIMYIELAYVNRIKTLFAPTTSEESDGM